MSIRYEYMPPKPAPLTLQAQGATCDACGLDAWYPAHKLPHARFARVRDDKISNTDIWELDLCERCKDQVMILLEAIAESAGLVLPDTSERIYPDDAED